MTNTVRYPLILGVVCLAAGLALAITFNLTIDRIEDKNDQKRAAAIVTAFFDAQPQTNTWNNVKEFDAQTHQRVQQRRKGQQTYLVAYRDDAQTDVLGYAAEGSFQGYSSKIVALVGVEPLPDAQDGDYRILGVRIIHQNETPGLGSQSNQVFSDETIWSWASSLLTGDEDGEAVVPTDRQQQALGQDVVLMPRPAFEQQFTGKIVTVTDEGLEGLQLEKGAWEAIKQGEKRDSIAAITGATVTSNAATNAVIQAIETIDHILATRPEPR